MGLKHQKSNQINLLAIVLSILLRFTLLIILWHLQNILVNNKVLRCCINILGYFYHTQFYSILMPLLYMTSLFLFDHARIFLLLLFHMQVQVCKIKCNITITLSVMFTAKTKTLSYEIHCERRGRRDCMIVGFTTTYTISVYHH